MTLPNETGDEHTNPNNGVDEPLYSEFIVRTHRSHKPYGKDVDSKFKTKFIEAWKNEANDTYEKIC